MSRRIRLSAFSLVSILIASLSSSGQAQSWRWIYPTPLEQSMSSPQWVYATPTPVSNGTTDPFEALDAKRLLILDPSASSLLVVSSRGEKRAPVMTTKIVEPALVRGTQNEVPNSDLPLMHFDSTTIFRSADIARMQGGPSMWYGARVPGQFDYDPDILIHSHDPDLDPEIQLGAGQNLMLWLRPGVVDSAPTLSDDGSTLHFNQLPSFKIDTSAVSINGSSILVNADIVNSLSKQNYYYKQDGKRYYMQHFWPKDVEPKMEHKVSPNIWLIDSGKK